jgi:hypothetical protein
MRDDEERESIGGWVMKIEHLGQRNDGQGNVPVIVIAIIGVFDALYSVD